MTDIATESATERLAALNGRRTDLEPQLAEAEAVLANARAGMINGAVSISVVTKAQATRDTLADVIGALDQERAALSAEIKAAQEEAEEAGRLGAIETAAAALIAALETYTERLPAADAELDRIVTAMVDHQDTVVAEHFRLTKALEVIGGRDWSPALFQRTARLRALYGRLMESPIFLGLKRAHQPHVGQFDRDDSMRRRHFLKWCLVTGARPDHSLEELGKLPTPCGVALFEGMEYENNTRPEYPSQGKGRGL